MSIARRLSSLAVLLLLSNPAAGGSIELLAPDQTCRLTIPAGAPATTFSIVAVDVAEVHCCGGFSSAEFRVIGLGSEWLTVTTPNPAAKVVFGDPLGDGINIAFPFTIWDPDIPLFSVSITYLVAGVPPPTTLRVVHHLRPSNPNAVCPRIMGDGGCPCTHFPCVSGGSLYINGEGDCLVGIAPATWSGVKELYLE